MPLNDFVLSGISDVVADEPATVVLTSGTTLIMKEMIKLSRLITRQYQLIMPVLLSLR